METWLQVAPRAKMKGSGAWEEASGVSMETTLSFRPLSGEPGIKAYSPGCSWSHVFGP